MVVKIDHRRQLTAQEVEKLAEWQVKEFGGNKEDYMYETIRNGLQVIKVPAKYYFIK